MRLIPLDQNFENMKLKLELYSLKNILPAIYENIHPTSGGHLFFGSYCYTYFIHDYYIYDIWTYNIHCSWSWKLPFILYNCKGNLTFWNIFPL